MSNIQTVDDLPPWLQGWAKAILSPPFSQHMPQAESIELIQNVLGAILRGDSCLAVSATQAQQLGHLVIDDKQAIEKVAPFVFDGTNLYLYRYWILEQRLAQHVLRLQKQTVQAVNLAKYPNLLSDQYQQQALKIVAEHAFSIITGGPGTGKTYTLARIIAVLNEAIPNLKIAMAAPTGKAAQRMEEAIMASFQDPALDHFSIRHHKPKPITLHRLLGLGHQQQAKFNAEQPLPYDLIVIDEASMLDLHLAQMLFAAIPSHARLILLGDAHQLASVDVGSVLADLQQMALLKPHCVNLRTSRRFKEDALIKKMADFMQRDDLTTQILTHFEREVVAANQLQNIDLSTLNTDILQLEYLTQPTEISQLYDRLYLGYQTYIEALKQYLANQQQHSNMEKVIEAFDQYRILAAIRYGELGVQQLNQQIEQRLLQDLHVVKQGEWYVGRAVMMTYNDYQIGLSNGDIGICFQRAAHFEVYFPSLNRWIPATRLPKNIQTAFSLTIHKSQGSEFNHTAVVLDEHATILMSKELIYTAITRAKKVVSILAAPEALSLALTRRTSRKSGLLNKINNMIVSLD